MLDWLNPLTGLPDFEEPGAIDGGAADGGAAREAFGGEEVEREGESQSLEPKAKSQSRGAAPPEELRESHPDSKPVIEPDSNELVGADVNDQSRSALQPHSSEKQKKKS